MSLCWALLLEHDLALLTVASLQTLHLTTCWCVLPSMLITDWHILQLIIGIPPCDDGVYGGGSSSTPIAGTVTTSSVDIKGLHHHILGMEQIC